MLLWCLLLSRCLSGWLHLIIDLIRTFLFLFVLSRILSLAIGELELLLLRYAVNILEFSLPIPILIEEVVVTLELLSDLAHQMQILLSDIPSDAVFRVLIILHFHPKEPFTLHERHHEPEVEAPDHDDHQDNEEGHHDELVIHFVVLLVLVLVISEELVLLFVCDHLVIELKTRVDGVLQVQLLQVPVNFVDAVDGRYDDDTHGCESCHTSDVL